MRLLVVDLESGQVNERSLADPLAGGRLLSSQLVSELVDAAADPLGPANALVFTAGPLAGYRISTAGRLSVGAKSPLTGGIKEANAGGMAGDSLAALDCRALVFRGCRPADKPAVFILDENGARLEDARPYWGLGNEAASAALFAAFGEDYVTLTIGQAGEQRLTAAGIAVSDANGQPFRLAARGGLGAVMGSKGLKGVLLRRAAGASLKGDARRAITAFHKLVANNDRTQVLRGYGTASTLMTVQTLGGLPVRNFSVGRLPDASPISGDTLRDLILARGGAGAPTEACMAGCVIQCSNIFPDERGELAAAPVEFETIGLCGSNLELLSFDAIARLNRLCNDFGLDTIEVGAALGVMMEAAESGELPEGYDRAELPRFGDAGRAAEIVAGVPQGAKLARLVASGVVATGKALGAKRIPAVKGQAISAYDPRVVKGTGVTYATSPQGADHTAGLTIFAPVDPLDASKAVGLSRASQIQRAAYDALGLCVFNIGATGRQPDLILDMLRAIYNVQLVDHWLDELGMQVIKVEKAFNAAAGMTSADDRLPDYFTSQILPPTGAVFDVAAQEMDRIFD